MSQNKDTILDLVAARLEMGKEKYGQPVRVLDTGKISFLSPLSGSSKYISPKNYWRFHALEEFLDAIVYTIAAEIYDNYEDIGTSTLVDPSSQDSIDQVYDQMYKTVDGDNTEIMERLKHLDCDNEYVKVLVRLTSNLLDEIENKDE